MYDTVKQRLTHFLESIKMSKTEFGRRIEVSSAFITSMRQSIQPDKIKSIALNFPELNTDWLMTGEGEMLRVERQKTGKEPIADILVPASVWQVVLKQADSLAARDKQVDELITIIKDQQQEMKKIAAQADVDVIYADAK